MPEQTPQPQFSEAEKEKSLGRAVEGRLLKARQLMQVDVMNLEGFVISEQDNTASLENLKRWSKENYSGDFRIVFDEMLAENPHLIEDYYQDKAGIAAKLKERLDAIHAHH